MKQNKYKCKVAKIHLVPSRNTFARHSQIPSDTDQSLDLRSDDARPGDRLRDLGPTGGPRGRHPLQQDGRHQHCRGHSWRQLQFVTKLYVSGRRAGPGPRAAPLCCLFAVSRCSSSGWSPERSRSRLEIGETLGETERDSRVSPTPAVGAFPIWPCRPGWGPGREEGSGDQPRLSKLSHHRHHPP